MRGTHDRLARVTITFNSQFEVLEAPGGKIYLPCDTCGKVLTVEKNTVAIECEECAEIRERLGFVLVCPNGCCPETEAPFKVDPFVFARGYHEEMGVLVNRDYSVSDFLEDGRSRVTNAARDIAQSSINQGVVVPVCVCCGAKAYEDIQHEGRDYTSVLDPP